MAFGQNSASSRSFGPNAKLYYAAIKQKNLPAPLFEIKRKKAGTEKEYEPVDDKAKFLSGNLTDIRNKKSKFEGKDIESVSATFQDGDDIVFLTIPHNYLGWNILNSFCNLQTFNGIEVGVYQSKPREGQTKTFPSSAVRQGGELIKARFANQELPEIPKHKIGNDVISDKTARIAFFVAQVEELSKRVRASVAASPVANHGAQTPAPSDVDEPAPHDDGPTIPDDVPF